MRFIEPFKKGVALMRGVRARQVVQFVNAMLKLRVAVGNKSELIISDQNATLVLGRGLFRQAAGDPATTTAAGLNPRGPWTIGETYAKNDMVHIRETGSIGSGDPYGRTFYYSTWYWPHDTAPDTSIGNHPSVFSNIGSDVNDSNWLEFIQGGGGSVIYSQSISALPPDITLSWYMISVCTMPCTWGHSGDSVLLNGVLPRYVIDGKTTDIAYP